ncbi:MAG: glycoside hydrolase family 20 protein [Odoribacter sp.]
MRKVFRIIGMAALTGLLVSCMQVQKSANYRVIPLPQKIATIEGQPFVINDGLTILYPEGNEKMQKNAEFLAAYMKEITGKNYVVKAGTEGEGAIILSLGLEVTNPEAYQLKVTDKTVTIAAPTEAGVFYGIQTLRKSLPVVKNVGIVLPSVEINDAPRFGYRGMMLDVGRHFFPVECIKKYIDILALHNINRFHWHLTDDQGWRIEMKKHPELTSIGSQRKETVIGHNSEKYDGIPYGGFYTQEEAKEVVAYAQDRYITVIPEIDMPGHMQGALSAYPELGCTGGPYEVWTMWGVSEDVLCAGNDKTLTFIDDILGELIEIFPSEYIHVGGDECPKVRWKNCPKCQAKIKALGLKADGRHSAEDRLQSYVIAHAASFLNERGRKIIGWDEILEGGLAPGATVMSWRGMNGGIEAAGQQHNAIMTPTTFLYFDYYQTNNRENEPMAIGGYVPIEKVYSLEPIPEILKPEERKYIIGVQANLWTEYIPNFEQVEYMVMPRIAALSEIQWTQPEQKNYQDFIQRIPHLFDIYNLEGYNYAKHLFDIKAECTPNPTDGTLDITFSTIDSADIYYTLDGTEPTVVSLKYAGVLKVKENCIIQAVVIRPTGNSRIFSEKIVFNKASIKPITLNQPVNEQYKFKGASTLVDGLQGDENYKTGRWIAFYGNDLEAVIDLQQPTEMTKAKISTCVEKGDWIFDVRGFSVEVSDDGVNYTKLASEEYPMMQQEDRNGIYYHELTFDAVKARYVKVIALSEHTIPAWHGGKGKTGFLFVDEIVLN